MRQLLVLSLLVPFVAAQQDTGFKISTTTQLIVVNVAVKDKSGNPIDDLEASDFTVTEDGKPQHLQVFEYQRLEDAALPPVELKTRATQPPAPSATISPAGTGEVKYKDRRLLVLFFDQAGMPVADQLRSQQSALRFINGQMTQSDMVAIMTYSTTMNVVQDFTSDRELLVTRIKALGIADTGMSNGSTGSDADADTSAAYTQDDRRVQYLQHRPQTRRAQLRRQNVEQPAREESARLLRQRHDPQRHRQPGAATCHYQ